MSNAKHSRASILKARARLSDLLDAISNEVADMSLERCPYRAVGDACTFEFGCRNQLRDEAGVKCGGGPLDISPAVVPCRS